MLYWVVLFFVAFGGFMNVITNEGYLAKGVSVLVAGALCVVLLGMMKARKRRIAGEKQQAAARQQEENQLAQLVQRNRRLSESKSIEATVVGGSGFAFASSQKVGLGWGQNSIQLVSLTDGALLCIDATDLTEMEISGPGTVTSNAGVVGGGFGLEGFLQGAVAAAVINAATTKSTTNTFARIATKHGEIFLHTSEVDPATLRIMFSQVFVQLANKPAANAGSRMSVGDELAKLKKLLDEGALTPEEFSLAKSGLLK